MIPENIKKLLEKQQYEFTGKHSAVKICSWTKKSLRDEGFCYKQKFYGIKSHLCCQTSVTMNYCDMACVYCWRERFNAPFSEVDEPQQVIENSIIAQRRLLTGFGGLKKTNMEKLKQAANPKHFAISLTGETLYYPKICELVKELRKRGITSFVVTNGMLPEVLLKMEREDALPTQLYVSIDSPDAGLQKELCNPMHADAWERLMKSLDVLKSLKGKTRTTLRLTMVKGLNMISPEKYAALLERADPDFVEVKAYMFVGASQLRLDIKNMPYHPEVVEFAEQICEHCDYKIIDEQEESRVVLLMKEDSEDRVMRF